LIAVRTTSDLAKSNFILAGPNQINVLDITEHPSKDETFYARVVLNIFASRAVWWTIDRCPDTALVDSAANMAARSRDIPEETIINAGHGRWFRSWADVEPWHDW